MTLYEFNQLPPEDRYNLVWKDARYVIGRSEGENYFNL